MSFFTLLLLSNYFTHALPTAELLLGLHSTPSYVPRHEQPSQADATILGHYQTISSAALQVRSSISRRWIQRVLGKWEIIYEHVSIFLPPQTVAPVLAEFYNSIIRNTISDWVLRMPTNHLLLRRGSIELELWTPKGVVPWYFVHDLGILLLNWSVLGNVGRFNAVFFNEQLDHQIVVAMRLCEAAATT